MRILLLGKHGQLGWELHRTLSPLGQITAFDLPEIDLSNPDSIASLTRQIKPRLIVNATAYTAVDRAESEPEAAMAVNGKAPRLLAELAAEVNSGIIHYSTDYVFDGKKEGAYLETDQPNPVNEYGRTKLAGERAVQQLEGAYLVLRTSWVYSLRGDSFVNKVLKWSREHPTLRVVSDQIANPTWARMLAETTASLLAKSGDDVFGWMKERRGIYHLAGSGTASRLEWARAILELDPQKNQQLAGDILPAKTSDFPTPAQRPKYSALNCDRFTDSFRLQLPPWKETLRLAMAGH